MLYAVMGLCNMTVSEVLPLWVVTPIHDGGLNFDSSQIGMAIAFTGPVQILTQIFIYPWLVNRLGVLSTCKLGIYVYAASVVLFPWVSLTRHMKPSLISWSFLVLVLTIANVSALWCFTSVFVLINNSCFSKQRATVNGIGQTFASLGRMIGPISGGSLFAWSETNGLGWPLNFHFTFYVIAAVSLAQLILAVRLPESISRKKVEPSDSESPPTSPQEPQEASNVGG